MGSGKSSKLSNFIVSTLTWAGHAVRMQEGRSAFKIFISKSTGKRPLGRLKRIWEDNIRINPKDTCINTRNWVDKAQVRDYWKALVNAAFNLRVS